MNAPTTVSAFYSVINPEGCLSHSRRPVMDLSGEMVFRISEARMALKYCVLSTINDISENHERWLLISRIYLNRFWKMRSPFLWPLKYVTQTGTESFYELLFIFPCLFVPGLNLACWFWISCPVFLLYFVRSVYSMQQGRDYSWPDS